MKKIRLHRAWLLAGTAILLSAAAPLQVFADASSEVAIVAGGTCANKSELSVIQNTNTTRGIIATVGQTVTASAKSSVIVLTISLNPGEKKPLGCAVQDARPATDVQFRWQIQNAQYR
jgi:hypothetical protein